MDTFSNGFSLSLTSYVTIRTLMNRTRQFHHQLNAHQWYHYIKGDPPMLGRKEYTQKEFDHGKAAIEELLTFYKKLAKAIASEIPDNKAQSALDDFERVFFNNLTLVLDRLYVHRLRMVTGLSLIHISEPTR